jgi:hypothetical protein
MNRCHDLKYIFLPNFWQKWLFSQYVSLCKNIVQFSLCITLLFKKKAKFRPKLAETDCYRSVQSQLEIKIFDPLTCIDYVLTIVKGFDKIKSLFMYVRGKRIEIFYFLKLFKMPKFRLICPWYEKNTIWIKKLAIWRERYVKIELFFVRAAKFRQLAIKSTPSENWNVGTSILTWPIFATNLLLSSVENETQESKEFLHKNWNMILTSSLQTKKKLVNVFLST